MKTKVKNPEEKIVWDTSNIENDLEFEFEWECMTDWLTEWMHKLQKGNLWHCEVENFGWRKLNGYKDFKANTGQELLRQILPNTDCTFNIRREGKTLILQNYHHDNCTGDEVYRIMRAK